MKELGGKMNPAHRKWAWMKELKGVERGISKSEFRNLKLRNIRIYLLLLSLVIGCAKAPYPISYVDKAECKIEGVPEEREDDEFGTKGDYLLSTWLLGLGAAAYHIYQVIRVGDDAIVYNYKRAFIESPVKFGFDGKKCGIYLSKAF